MVRFIINRVSNKINFNLNDPIFYFNFLKVSKFLFFYTFKTIEKFLCPISRTSQFSFNSKITFSISLNFLCGTDICKTVYMRIQWLACGSF